MFFFFLAPILLKEAAKISSASNTSIKLEPAHFEDLFSEELKKYDSFLSTCNKLSDFQEKVLASISVGDFLLYIYIFFICDFNYNLYYRTNLKNIIKNEKMY